MKRYVFKVVCESQKSLAQAVHIVCLPRQQSLHYDNCYQMQQNVKRDLTARGFKRIKYECGILSASWDCELDGGFKNVSF